MLTKKQKKQIKREYKSKQKRESEKSIFRFPMIDDLSGNIIGLNAIVFSDLKQVLEWYLDENKVAGVVRKGFLQENEQEVYWKYRPLLIAKVGCKQDIFEKLFTLSEEEIEKAEKRRLEGIKNGDLYFPDVIYPTYRDSLIGKMQRKKRKALKLINLQGGKYYAIYETKYVQVLKED